MIEGAKKILVMGLGGAGISSMSRMVPKAPEGMSFVALDCDAQSLERCENVEQSHLIGQGVTDSMSSGGDLETGRRCLEASAGQIETMVDGVDLLIVVVGLGGGFGSGAAPVVARIARSSGAHTLFFTILPFPFEGGVVRSKAQSSLRRLRVHANAVVQIPNKRIQLVGNEAFGDSFNRSDETVSAGVIGVWRMLSYGGICNLDFADLHTLIHYCDAMCRYSCATVSGENRVETLVSELRAHPLAGEGAIFKEAPGLLVAITGGNDLTLSEAQQLMESIVPDNEECWVKMGVTIDPEFDGCISAIVLAAEAWKEPLVDDGYGGLKPASGKDQQGELAGVLKPRSRTFGDSERTIWNGEDLDIPTFLRRKIKLPR